MIITKNEVTSTNTSINPPSQLTSSVPRTISAITAITNGIQQLERLPTTSSSITPNLAGHINAAKANGNTWIKTLRPSLVTILKGISDFSSTFDAEYNALLAAAKKIGTDDSEAIAEFKTQLTKLQTVSKRTAGEASAAQPAISAFNNNVNTDSRNFRSDQQQANAAHSSAVQNVQNAQRRIQSLEQERAKKQEILNSLGIFSPLAKAIEELIEALTGQIGAQQREMEQAQRIAQQAYMDLQATQQALGATHTYLSTAGAISSEVNALMDGWETLDSNFNVLLASEKITAFNVFTQDVLAAVKADWQNLAKQAEGLK